MGINGCKRSLASIVLCATLACARAQQLTHWSVQNPSDPVLPQSNSFDEFILELKASVDRHMLPNRSIDYIFSDHSVVPPGACSHPTRLQLLLVAQWLHARHAEAVWHSSL